MTVAKVQFSFINHLEECKFAKVDAHEAVATDVPLVLIIGETSWRYSLPAGKRSSVTLYYAPQGHPHNTNCLIGVSCAQMSVTPNGAADFVVSGSSRCPHTAVKATPQTPIAGDLLKIVVSFAGERTDG